MALIKNSEHAKKEEVKQSLSYSHVPCDAVIDLQREGKERGKRLTLLESTVRTNDILVKDALGIREKNNGERKKQIEEAFSRITEIKEQTEDEDKSLRELLIENKVQVAEIKGYIQGQDKREVIHDRKESREFDLWNKKYNKYIALLTIIAIILAFFQVKGGFHL